MTASPLTPPRLVVGIAGGSGMVYALDLLRSARTLECEIHLVVSAGAEAVIPTELDETLQTLESLADIVHADHDLAAPISSGSYPTAGMIVVPCSSGTLAKVAHGMTGNLLARAAHVTLKERRPLVLVVREAPYSRPMLRNMLEAFDAGATILPASPGFYHRPETVADLIGGITARALDLVGIANKRSRRWRE